MHLPPRGIRFRVSSLALVAIGLVACGSGEPEYPIPDYLSPESREKLASFQDLRECRAIGFALMMSEVIALSSPIEYAAGAFGQSAAQGKLSEPGMDTAMATSAAMQMCCHQIHKQARIHHLSHVMEGLEKGRISREENVFWRRFIQNSLDEDGNCHVPLVDLPPDRNWPSGRRS